MRADLLVRKENKKDLRIGSLKYTFSGHYGIKRKCYI
jgi:hypothetical protein